MRVILDTNVFVSGILFQGTPQRIIKAWGERHIELVVSPAILDEYIRVAEDLAAIKGIDITSFIQMVAVQSTIWNAPKFADQVCTDADDDKFLECAVYSRTRIIVSGDKALLKTSGYRRVQVLTPAEFARKFLKG